MAPNHPPLPEQTKLMQQRGAEVRALADEVMPERKHTAHAEIEIPGSTVQDVVERKHRAETRADIPPSRQRDVDEVVKRMDSRNPQIYPLEILPYRFKDNPVAALGAMLSSHFGNPDKAMAYLLEEYPKLFPGDKEDAAQRFWREVTTTGKYSPGEQEAIRANFDRLYYAEYDMQQAKAADQKRQQMLVANPLDPEFKAELIAEYSAAFLGNPLKAVKALAFGPINEKDNREILGAVSVHFPLPGTALDYLLNFCRTELGYDEAKLKELRDTYADKLPVIDISSMKE